MKRFRRSVLVAVCAGIGLIFLPARPQLAAEPLALEPRQGTHANYTEKMPGGEVSFEMIAIPGGTFVMGSPDDEAGRNEDEGPQRKVRLNPFWMMKCEVTWDEFDLYWKTEPEADPTKEPTDPNVDAVSRPTPPYVDETYNHEREKHPALCMTHHNAMEYCRWLSLKTGKYYRLPTEAEWEYACRAGSSGPYCCEPAQLEDYAWFKKNSADEDHPDGTTHTVGTKKPNAFGLHDMHGNVMEWCLDHYKKDMLAAYDPMQITLGPVIVPTERKWSHTARGGSWADDPIRLRCAARRASEKSWMKHDPQRPQSIWWLTKFDVIGFRVVRAVEEQENLKNLRSKVTKESE